MFFWWPPWLRNLQRLCVECLVLLRGRPIINDQGCGCLAWRSRWEPLEPVTTRGKQVEQVDNCNSFANSSTIRGNLAVDHWGARRSFTLNKQPRVKKSFPWFPFNVLKSWFFRFKIECTMAEAMEIKAIKIFKSTKLIQEHFSTKPDDFLQMVV